jgi:hypothetical protein
MAATKVVLGCQPLSLKALAALLCVGLFVFLGVAALWNHSALFQLRYWLRSLRPLPLVLGVTILLGANWLVAVLATLLAPLGACDVLAQTGWLAVKKPFLFGIAHVVYYGPIVLLALLRWRRVCGGLHVYGPGLVLCVSANLLLSLHCESRFVIPWFPVLVLGVVKAMEDVRWRAPHYAVFVLLALVFSKCWLQLGGMPDSSHPGEFPAQLFFMNLGPWMSGQMYVVQAAAVLFAGSFLLALLYPPLQLLGHLPGLLGAIANGDVAPLEEPRTPLAAWIRWRSVHRRSSEMWAGERPQHAGTK